MEKELLNRLHEEDNHEEIIKILESEGAEHDYDTICYLARAYNNRGEEGDYDKAADLLQMVYDMGKDDPLWHYRLGYAYFFSGRYEDALMCFEESLHLDPSDEDVDFFITECKEQILRRNGLFDEELNPEVYSSEEEEIIETYIEETFGEFESVFHELVSPDIHVDICVIPPTEERNFYTLVTMGMGAHRMNVPEDLSEYKLQRAELVICLPPYWDLESEKEEWYWPIRLLKVLARLPIQEDAWLGWGHTIDNGEGFDESTQLCGSMLITPVIFDEEEYICPLTEGEEVNFYQIIPLYKEEMDFKMQHGADDLLKQLDGRVLVVDPKRQKFSPEKLLS